jgi:hypothetical protein
MTMRLMGHKSGDYKLLTACEAAFGRPKSMIRSLLLVQPPAAIVLV